MSTAPGKLNERFGVSWQLHLPQVLSVPVYRFGEGQCQGFPAAPNSLNTVVTGSVVGVNWNVEPGTVSTRLEVGYAPGATSLTFSFPAPTAGLSVNAPPNTYFVRVRAVNSCGPSAPSVERTVVVP